MTNNKKWYKSKTFWVNIIMGVAIAVQWHYGFVVAPEEQAGLVVVINLLLRGLTKTGLELE